ncbi:MAG TPA: hypothetical protein PLG15_05435, partial [Candidatus Gastranaerophilaceae bacterium]|nr:hypothetical protein [Candidatus Gastranaerophilaceae bacterium]
KVEKIGIEFSKQSADEADLILFLYDATKGIKNDDKAILDLIKDKNYINIAAKSDLLSNVPLTPNPSAYSTPHPNPLALSHPSPQPSPARTLPSKTIEYRFERGKGEQLFLQSLAQGARGMFFLHFNFSALHPFSH